MAATMRPPTTITNYAAALILWCGAAACGSDATKTHDGTIATPYLAIGSALASDSVEGIAPLATQVVDATAKHAGEPGVDEIVAGAGALGSADLAAARRAYKTMSDGVVEYMRADPATRADRMLVHCTMAFEGKGALWVQAKGKVSNPYEGSAMPTCGDVLDWDAELPET
jgi:hypothetical protein